VGRPLVNPVEAQTGQTTGVWPSSDRHPTWQVGLVTGSAIVLNASRHQQVFGCKHPEQPGAAVTKRVVIRVSGRTTRYI
jgi:hypothetical protein